MVSSMTGLIEHEIPFGTGPTCDAAFVRADSSKGFVVPAVNDAESFPTRPGGSGTPNALFAKASWLCELCDVLSFLAVGIVLNM